MRPTPPPPLIAVVDDQDGIRVALQRLLRAAGFGVRTYGSGIEFLRQGTEAWPDCLVLDLHLQGHSGFDVLMSLANTPSPLPVVVLTGDDTAANRRQALQNGASSFLAKPVNDEVLIGAIVAAMEARLHE
jgi:FixJ family two-component response regulator